MQQILIVVHLVIVLALVVLIAMLGEVLDYRDMVAHYAGAQQHIIEGSDHGISEFADYLDEVLAFCGIGAQS